MVKKDGRGGANYAREKGKTCQVKAGMDNDEIASQPASQFPLPVLMPIPCTHLPDVVCQSDARLQCLLHTEQLHTRRHA